MIKQKSLIGLEVDRSIHTIERSKFDRLHHAFADPSIPHTHPSTTKNETVFMPNFLAGSLINLPMIYSILGLNSHYALLSRESIICHLPLTIGDMIVVRTFLKDAYEQQASSNPIGFIILESVGRIKDDLAFYAERVIAVRGGFHRGR